MVRYPVRSRGLLRRPCRRWKRVASRGRAAMATATARAPGSTLTMMPARVSMFARSHRPARPARCLPPPLRLAIVRRAMPGAPSRRPPPRRARASAGPSRQGRWSVQGQASPAQRPAGCRTDATLGRTGDARRSRAVRYVARHGKHHPVPALSRARREIRARAGCHRVPALASSLLDRTDQPSSTLIARRSQTDR